MKKSGCVLFVKKYAIVQSVAGLKILNLGHTGQMKSKISSKFNSFREYCIHERDKERTKKKAEEEQKRKEKKEKKEKKRRKKQEKNKKSENEDDDDSNNKDNESKEDSEKVSAVKEKLDIKKPEKSSNKQDRGKLKKILRQKYQRNSLSKNKGKRKRLRNLMMKK